jgi:nucleotide-binding universal stress UspA family protein
MERAAHGRIESMLAAYPDVRSEVKIEESHNPVRAILDAGARYDADLIVIGSHGYSLVERILGTTAAGIVNTAPRDVLVVRASTASGTGHVS